MFHKSFFRPISETLLGFLRFQQGCADGGRGGGVTYFSRPFFLVKIVGQLVKYPSPQWKVSRYITGFQHKNMFNMTSSAKFFSLDALRKLVYGKYQNSGVLPGGHVPPGMSFLGLQSSIGALDTRLEMQ